MRTQLSLVQAIGFCLVYVALGFLYPIVSISLNPFEAAPFWIVTSALAVLLIGLVLGLLVGRFTPQFKPTRLQWLGFGLLSLVLYLGGFLLSTHGTHVREAIPIATAIVIVFTALVFSNRSQKSSQMR
jgi:drug/metabolite transporter (DMT)-like permease